VAAAEDETERPAQEFGAVAQAEVDAAAHRRRLGDGCELPRQRFAKPLTKRGIARQRTSTQPPEHLVEGVGEASCAVVDTQEVAAAAVVGQKAITELATRVRARADADPVGEP